ncbi:MAG: cation diffusion facilitator family transporter [Candidatus Nealsonbacteria bacterium]|nr:MAG: cation diffusion facilitator family transporter [Candidatus Nealsonbacteria bacterium]
MNPEKVSIISTIVNFVLAVFKLIAGLIVGSVALIADAIHSGLDVFSSLVTFLGIKTAKKPVDEKHPYGFYRAETLAGLIVALLLALSAVWIIYEGISRFLKLEPVIFTFWAIGLMVVSMVVNEGMARLKFYYGRKYESLSLVADAEHSRADVISSLGVLVGLILIRYFIYADAIIAILIGLYIVWQSFGIGKEITDSLLDVSNKNVEERIRKICAAHKIGIPGLKTRKIGAANFAEIKIELDPKLRVAEVSKITKTLEDRLLRNIPELKYIVISIEPHKMRRSTIVPDFGKTMCTSEGFEQIGPKKLGERIIIPVENGEISKIFGAKEYLVIDKKNEKILRKEMVKNPFFEEGFAHGARFAKAISADKVTTREIGPNAKANLESFNIEIELTDKKLESILKNL